MQESAWKIIPIDLSVSGSEFDCGDEALNRYLNHYALRNHKSGIGKTFVATATGDQAHRVIGYYTVSMGQITCQSLPDKMRKLLPRYPIPVCRIGKLGVDRAAQGQGLGEFLLMHALHKTAVIAEEIGVFAVIVDAKDDRAKAFYQRYGFMAFEDEPLSCFLPIQTVISVT